MKSLLKYSNIIKEYTEFLTTNKYPAKAILSSDNINFCLGYILEFLSTKNIYVLVDNYNYYVYTDIEYAQIDNYIFAESDSTNYTGVIQNYRMAIDKTFETLNKPF